MTILQAPDGLKLFLWGFMGSGKTSVGRALADALEIDFIDLDVLVSEREQLTVAQIFQNKGESYFRELEHEILKEVLTSQTNAVVSTGGGTPCFYNQDELMNSNGITIYIHLSQKTLKNRLDNDQKKSRPLISSSNWVDIQKLYKSRKPIYTKAQITINGDKSVSELVPYIIDRVIKTLTLW